MKVSAESFYIDIYENLTQKDGTSSYYNRLMFNPSLVEIGEYVSSKSDLKEKVDEEMKIVVGSLEGFTVEETGKGWVYTRYVKWVGDEEDEKMEIVKEGEHTDKEEYSVEVQYYRDIYGKDFRKGYW